MGYNNSNDTMKKENNELQSRREFFKKAAKGALPILGAVILASSPIISKAVEKEPMGCSSGCMYSCRVACYDNCTTSCHGGCKGGCKGTCTGSCFGSCVGSCNTSCSGVAY